MKKILIFIIAAAMLCTSLLVFASCNSGDGDDTTAADTSANGATTADTSAAETSSAAPAGTLKMGTNAAFKPYEYKDGDKIVGIDAEIAAAIAAKLGMELEIVDMSFDSIITAVDAGSVDFGMAGMTVTDERKESVDFTVSYANGIQAIIVKNDSPITDVDVLCAEGATYKVGVQLGTTGDIYSTDDFGKDRVVEYQNGNEAVMALKGGSVDCVIIDNEPAKALVAANEGLKILETQYANEDYAICVKKGNTEFLNKLNTAIDALVADGTVDKILDKYIK